MPLTYLVVIAGPTGIGKTGLAIQLASQFNTQIISADSRQFFRELTIGTARPSEAEMQGVTHHFTGNLSVNDAYNAGNFEVDVLKLLACLFEKNKVVIMAGGSGLYLDAVCKGFDPLPVADENIRTELNALYKKEGLSSLQKTLKEKDPEYYKKADIQNPQRMIRALEVCIGTGKPYSSFLMREKKSREFECIWIGLNTERKKLYEKINRRVDKMMEEGLLEEAKKVYPLRHLNALQTVGYQELFDYMEDKYSLPAAIELIKQNTRHFAKKQLTWFGKNKDIAWFEPTEFNAIATHIGERINSK